MSQCWLQGYDSPYCAFARDSFNYGVTENAMKWPQMEPQENNFNTYDIEQMFNWSQQKGWGFRGHCLFWDVPGNNPGWINGLSGQELVDKVHHRIDTAMPQFQVIIRLCGTRGYRKMCICFVVLLNILLNSLIRWCNFRKSIF